MHALRRKICVWSQLRHKSNVDSSEAPLRVEEGMRIPLTPISSFFEIDIVDRLVKHRA